MWCIMLVVLFFICVCPCYRTRLHCRLTEVSRIHPKKKPNHVHQSKPTTATPIPSAPATAAPMRAPPAVLIVGGMAVSVAVTEAVEVMSETWHTWYH